LTERTVARRKLLLSLLEPQRAHTADDHGLMGVRVGVKTAWSFPVPRR
jgi:hypothetical protein